eukprot:2347463-Pyramimonas_sp.AAC.1
MKSHRCRPGRSRKSPPVVPALKWHRASSLTLPRSTANSCERRNEDPLVTFVIAPIGCAIRSKCTRNVYEAINAEDAPASTRSPSLASRRTTRTPPRWQSRAA